MTSPAKAHQIILFLLFSSFSVQLALASGSLSLVLVAGQVISLLMPLLGYLALTGGRYRERLGLKGFRIKDLLLGLGATLLLQPFLLLLATAVEAFSGNPMAALLETLADTPSWMTVTGLAVMPALIEEAVFRGFLLGSYRRLPLGAAALLNGAIFGMFHMNLYQFSYAMVLGVFLSVVTRRSGSVLPAMAMHFLNNLISVFMVYQLDSGWYQALEALLKAGTTPGIGILGGAAAAALSLGVAWRLVQPRDQDGAPVSEEPEPSVGNLQQSLGFDWALASLVLIFGGLALAPPIQTFFRGL